MSGTQEPVDYRSLFRRVPTPLVVLDRDLVIVDVNDAYEAATMRMRQELVGRPILAAFPENPRDPSSPGVVKLDESLHRVLRLFDLFFRGNAARHHGIPGNGLGLTLVRAIVELHGGTISVSGPDQEATVFTVQLPTHQPATPASVQMSGWGKVPER